MKMNCDVIRDLLPLYADEVCSEASKALVEEHLQSCESCGKELRIMRSGEPSAIAEEVNTAQAAQKAWKRNKIVTAEKVLLAVVLLFAIGAVLFYPDMPMPVFEKDMKVNNVCRLQDGTVYFEWEMTDGTIAAGRGRMIREKDGAYYFVPLRAVIEAHLRWNMAISPDTAERQRVDIEFVRPYGKWSDYDQTVFEDMTAIYLGWGKDAILVWEQGMELPAASEEIEAEYAKMMG